MTFTVAIIGRPNVGKSTLFNRLVGKRVAIVDDAPGVTRDRREGAGKIADMQFRVIDTAGLEDVNDESLESRMRGQTEIALKEADVALMMFDARVGITPVDKHFSGLLRKSKTPVIVVANKCERGAGEAGRLEAYELGLGEPIAVSSEHGEGIDGLYDALKPYFDRAKKNKNSFKSYDYEFEDNDDDDAIKQRPLQMAIVGRPNVGKSTLVNCLLGSERMLTGPEAGITRDSISIPWQYKGRAINLIDTAGLRRKSRVTEKVEYLSTNDTRRAIDFSQVSVLVLDAEDMLEKQDLTIAGSVIDEGRALVIAVNKWDLIKDKKEAMQKLEDRLQTSLPQVRGVPIVTISAQKGKGMDKLLDAVFDVFEVWNRRISTGQLNRWLEQVLHDHQPPLVGGRRVKVRYMTQPKTRPPTFALFVSHTKGLPESYQRYLANALREDFELWGIPLRLHVRKGRNPYDNDE
ncbi:MAG: ribosome biogenesis GTPase Der [Rhodospirillaceae bacterium]|nr:ribosome biogenesis GTPase Der [Rhodospirillaceae bacterium]